MQTEPSALEFDRRRLFQVVLVLGISVSLHVVPQWLAQRISPALTMAALMIADALIIAAVARSGASMRATAGLAVILVVTYVSRQSQYVALPHVLVNLMLAAVFAFTLRRGQMPLIMRVVVHALGPAAVDARFAAYLRGATVAWSLFFLAVAATSALLALAAPFAVWSLFANVLAWPLVAVMFAAEYVVRRLFFPDLPAHTPLQTLAATMAMPRRSFTAS